MWVRNISLHAHVSPKQLVQVHRSSVRLAFCVVAPAGWPAAEALKILKSVLYSIPALHTTFKASLLSRANKTAQCEPDQPSRQVWLNFWGKTLATERVVSDCQLRPVQLRCGPCHNQQKSYVMYYLTKSRDAIFQLFQVQKKHLIADMQSCNH